MTSITERDLDEKLSDLNAWERFGLYLPGMSMNDIEKIRIERRHDTISLKKLSLYQEWLKKCSSPDWDHVVEALQNIDENTLASKILDKTRRDKNQQAAKTGSAKISKNVIDELDEMHREFCAITKAVIEEVETATNNESMSIKSIVSYTMQQRAFHVPAYVWSVRNADKFFEAIHQFYSFLDCYLIISLAIEFLSSGTTANRARNYKKDVNRFKDTTEIRLLRDQLDIYFPNVVPECKVKVTIVLENKWGTHDMWLAEELVKILFNLRSHDECMWFRVKPGSEVLTFLLPNNLMFLIGKCTKKIDFMKLVGVLSLQVGPIVVLNRNNNDDNFSFENSLIQAAETMNFELAKFLLEYFEIDVNKSKPLVTILETLDENMIKFLINKHAEFNETLKVVVHQKMREAVLQTNKPDVLNSFKAIVTDERPSYRPIVQQLTSVDDFIETLSPFHNFINCDLIAKFAEFLHLPMGEAYNTFISSIKNHYKLVYLDSFYHQHHKFFPPIQPKNTTMIRIFIILADVWQMCSINMMERLVHALFKLNPNECPWQDVMMHGGSMITFITPKILRKGLIEASKKNTEFMKLVGIMMLKIDDDVIIKEASNKDYTFQKGIEEAKKQKNKEASNFLIDAEKSSVITSYYNSVHPDTNRNFEFPFGDTVTDLTALMIASRNADAKLVKLLLANSADPNIETKLGKSTALMYAALSGSGRIVKMLIDHNADIDKVTVSRESSLSLATQNGCANIVKMLLAKKPNVNICDKDGLTPLFLASNFGHLHIVQMLLEAKADVTILDNDSQTSLFQAVQCNHLDVVKCLLEADVNPDVISEQEYSCLFIALNQNNLEMVNCLMTKANPNILTPSTGVSPFHVACTTGNLQICKTMLKSNANPNSRSRTGATPLHVASEIGHVNIVECLIAAKADIDVQLDNNGVTPLSVGCASGQLEVVHTLLKAKANPNIVCSGRTALHEAFKNNNIPLMELLLQYNADPNIRDLHGKAVLHCACASGNLTIVKLLLKAGAYTHLSAKLGTPLHFACHYRHIEIVKALLKDNNTNPNIRNEYGITSLMYACLAENVEIATILLRAKADPNIGSNQGTPLQVALITRNTSLIKILREHNATD